MQPTEKRSKERNLDLVKRPVVETLSSESGGALEVVTKPESEGLSKSLAKSLMGLIDKVNADGVTPETVNASCNAAAQIYKILRLNYDMKKDGF